ncbi:hypothetical protein SDJN02_03048, partial [Cucurbita argyrosperma subsp. argyrosperma]
MGTYLNIVNLDGPIPVKHPKHHYCRLGTGHKHRNTTNAEGENLNLRLQCKEY